VEIPVTKERMLGWWSKNHTSIRTTLVRSFSTQCCVRLRSCRRRTRVIAGALCRAAPALTICASDAHVARNMSLPRAQIVVLSARV